MNLLILAAKVGVGLLQGECQDRCDYDRQLGNSNVQRRARSCTVAFCAHGTTAYSDVEVTTRLVTKFSMNNPLKNIYEKSVHAAVSDVLVTRDIYIHEIGGDHRNN